MNVKLVNSSNGIMKQGKVGFSWTSLFFGFWVPLIRGDIVWFLVYAVASVCTFGIFCLVFPFFYNKAYTKKLLQKGFVPADDTAKQILVKKGIAMVNTHTPGNTTPVGKTAVQTTNQPVVNTASKLEAGSFGQKMKELIDGYVGSKTGHTNSFVDGNIPSAVLTKITKKFPPCNPSSENILFAGVYGKMAIYGIVITDRNMYWRLAKGMTALTKTGVIPLNTITSMSAEHTASHSSYGGSAPGPEITVNGKEMGFFQSMMVISKQDEEVLIGLINEINDSGILTAQS